MIKRGTLATLAMLPTIAIAVSAFAADAQRPTRRVAASRSTAIRAELAGVLLQSKRYDEAAREYATLVHYEPGNRAYRLGLARALAWGERLRDAEQQLLILARQRPGDPTVEALLASVRSGLRPSASEANAWLAEQRGAPAYRRTLARALAREGRTTEALAHYDTLLHARPIPEVLVDRAYVHVGRRDFAAAERDAHAAIAAGATPEAYLLLGDLYRWRGDFDSARAWYVRARVRDAESPEVSSAFARLARDERPTIAFIPDVDDAPGWETTNSAASDNLGADLIRSELRRGMRSQRGIDASIGVKTLRLGDRAATVPSAAMGYGADAAISREMTHRQFYVRGRARGGFIYHPSAELVPDISFTLAAFMNAWGAGFELSASPAYPSLVTLASMLPLPGDGTQLREQSSTLSLAGPLAAVDVALRHQSTTLSDENSRFTLQASARYPMRDRFALLYAGTAQLFARASPLYWSPRRYEAHGAGVEYAVRKLRGLSFAARALPGVAWTTERFALTGEDSVRTSALHLAGGVEATYRALGWEIGAGLTYGRGRAGEYQRVDALLQARFAP